MKNFVGDLQKRSSRLGGWEISKKNYFSIEG